MPVTFGLVCEADADFRIASSLVERELGSAVPWLDGELLASCPIWMNWKSGRPYLTWIEIAELARSLRLSIRGHFNGEAAMPDSQATRRALLVANQLSREASKTLDGIVLVRDDDRDANRKVGIQQAISNSTVFRDTAVVGLAHCNRECWVLAGFDALSESEVLRLDSMRRELGFDPTVNAHELTAKHDYDKKNSKRVLRFLVNNDRDRESSCWKSAPLNLLRERGTKTGLAEYLDSTKEIIIPIVNGREQKT